MARATNAGKKRFKFEYFGKAGDKVYVAGDFNGWNPTATPLKSDGDSGVYSRTIFLDKGQCEYKFVVNGMWCVDPECLDWTPNELGSLNSLMTI